MSIENYSKSHPYLSRVLQRYPLTKQAITDQTFHIVLGVDGLSFPFKVGDSIGVLPENDPEEVSLLLQKMGASGEEKIFNPKDNGSCTVREYLQYKANLSRVNLSFLKSAFQIDPQFFLPENKIKLTYFLDSHSLFDLLSMYPLENLSSLSNLMPLLPRFYSIANSAHMFPNELHLLVRFVSYLRNGHLYKGVCSNFLCNVATLDQTPVPIYLQPSHYFSLPQDPNASIICVCAGTGVAPFRAFLQERLATGSLGRNWLFFGERSRSSDFYYEEFWTRLCKESRLRLDVAFSRDTAQKTYVQHKLYEQRKSLWSWLQEGAFFYVCGNKEMADDVQSALCKIIAKESNVTEENASLYIKELRQSRRYLVDVY